VLFWSVIAAAFIGPGTVTAAGAAGARYGSALLWALAFSTLACLLLQESSARLTVAGGRDLGQVLRARHRHGAFGLGVVLLVGASIVVGCAAYEAGNILGGVAGAALGTGLSPKLLTAATGLGAGLLLLAGAPRTVARALGLLVAVMGVAFLLTAWRISPVLPDLLVGTLTPRVPEGAGLLVLGLVGTTVVPYNLFLGSGLARGQSLGDVRFGLSVAVLFGGLVSMGIVVVGSALDGPFGFAAIAELLAQRLGPWAASLFAAGLFSAGFSSAVTAPLAAAITLRGLIGSPDDRRWSDRGVWFRATWSAVLAIGVGFSLAGVRPVPAILIAQALNGVLLPFVAIFLLLAVNDASLMGSRRNGAATNVAMGIVVTLTLVLGVTHVTAALTTALGLPRPDGALQLGIAALVVAMLAWPVGRMLVRGSTGRDHPS
jgi:Mn2+/Fe2+ NRAMP family transporter